MKENKILNNKQKGSFLLELMIGLLLSILTVLGVVTLYAKFEGQKRTTAQVGQTVSMGAMAMFPIQHYTKMAGFGFNKVDALGCKVLAHNQTTNTDYSFTLEPLSINFGANDKKSDTVTLLMGSSDHYFDPISLSQNMSNSTDNVRIESRFGLQPGDVFVLSEAGKDCTLAQVSELPTVIGYNDVVKHDAGNYTDVAGNTKTTNYNFNSGVTYTTKASLLNLGLEPKRFIYSIENNQLIQNNKFDNTDHKNVIGDNIVMLKAIYGVDDDDDGNVDSWTKTKPTDLKKLIGVKIALIARSNLRERANGGACVITTNKDFTWSGGTMDISDLPDWKCYRYRMLQTTVPLRNILFQVRTS